MKKFNSDITKIAFKFKIVNKHVVKYNDNSFGGFFKFENGYHLSFTLVEGRSEFAQISSIEPTHQDEMYARCLAAEQHLKLQELFKNSTVLYGRAKYKFEQTDEYAISLYIKDDSSPTGVSQASISCSDKQAQNFGIFALSPTEDLRSVK